MTHLVCINPSTILIPGKTRARDRPSLRIRASYIYKTTLVALIHTFSIILVEIFLYTFFPADNTISYKKKTKKFTMKPSRARGGRTMTAIARTKVYTAKTKKEGKEFSLFCYYYLWGERIVFIFFSVKNKAKSKRGPPRYRRLYLEDWDRNGEYNIYFCVYFCEPS